MKKLFQKNGISKNTKSAKTEQLSQLEQPFVLLHIMKNQIEELFTFAQETKIKRGAGSTVPLGYVREVSLFFIVGRIFYGEDMRVRMSVG